jgi:hypothetical protein
VPEKPTYPTRKKKYPSENPSTSSVPLIRSQLPIKCNSKEKDLLITMSTTPAEVRIAVIGDSLSAQNYAMAPSWPVLAQEALRCSQVNAKVFNFSVPASTFYRVNTALNAGATQVSKTLSVNPDIIIVALGLNDTLNEVDGRTVAQVKLDASTLFTSLRAGAPSAKIVFMRELAYDSVNFPTPNVELLNKGTLGYYFQKKTSGILANCFTVELLDDSVNTTTKARLANWIELDSFIASNTSYWDIRETFDLFRIHRLGGAVHDMLHLTAAGQVLMRGYAMRALKDTLLSTTLPGLTMNPTIELNDPDELFATTFARNIPAKGWDYVGNNANSLGVVDSLWSTLRPHNWYLPRDIKWRYSHSGNKALRLGMGDVFTRSLEGAKPNTLVEISVDGAPFSASADLTNSLGIQISGQTAEGLVAYADRTTVFRYKVGGIVLDPISLTIQSLGTTGITLNDAIPVNLTPSLSRGINRSIFAGTAVVNIPLNSTTANPIGIPFQFMTDSTGDISFTAPAGVTLMTRPGTLKRSLPGPGTIVELVQQRLNVWVLSRDLA